MPSELNHGNNSNLKYAEKLFDLGFDESEMSSLDEDEDDIPEDEQTNIDSEPDLKPEDSWKQNDTVNINPSTKIEPARVSRNDKL